VLELSDGTLIAECTAITQYLDALDGNPTLSGQTPIEQGLIHMMTKRAEIEFLDAVSLYFHHATPGLGPQVELYQNPEWGNRMRDKAVRGMRYFDSVLKSQPFVAGDRFSMADIAVLGGIIFASLVRLPLPDECEALRAWNARMQERPSVREWRAMVERGASQT
jgi:glutathione S-transferase